ncbi:MAG: DUF116 domain-containing protein [Candidatus Latescibacterota bacterium]
MPIEPKKTDRRLGDEWENWTGDLDESRSYNETAGLFILYGSLALFILLASLGFVLYMIEPRLALVHPALVYAAWTVTITFALISGGLGVLIVASAFTGRNLLFSSRLGQVAAARILPLAFAIAHRLGISRDRLSNSFVRFSNAVVRATYRQKAGKTVILIPRCLKADVKKAVQELGERAGVGVFVATGGGEARQIIRKERPSAVIGVACERDLISGIRDVAPKIATLGITNQRPEGPCKNTIVDLNELRVAIRTLTGVSIEQ